MDLIENKLNYQIIEINLKQKKEESCEKNELYQILLEKGFNEFEKNEEKVVLRKVNIDQNEEKIGAQIKYDSLSVLTLINKSENNEINIINNTDTYRYFDGIINEVNYALLINTLKMNDKYKIYITNSSNIMDKISKLENIDFDFINSKSNECFDIDEVSNKKLLPERGYYYAMIKECLDIQISTLISLDIEGILYNGLKINKKKNIIEDIKYSNNLYYIPTMNKNIFIIIYQYNDIFEKEFFKNKKNIYNTFISLFNDMIKNHNTEEKKDENENKNEENNILWVPSFNIDTNLFTSKTNDDINIQNEQNNDMKIQEYNEFLNIKYLPDNSRDKSMIININNKNDIIIKDKFLLGICHTQFMQLLDIPIISLINVTFDNFLKS